MLHAVRLSMFLNVRLCHYRLLFWIVFRLDVFLTPHRFLGLGFAVHHETGASVVPHRTSNLPGYPISG